MEQGGLEEGGSSGSCCRQRLVLRNEWGRGFEEDREKVVQVKRSSTIVLGKQVETNAAASRDGASLKDESVFALVSGAGC